MDLILKPTERCNFACTFCSSSSIAEGQKLQDDLGLDKVFQFLDRYPETRTIIVNGGDPLMMKPDYYWEMIKGIEKRGMNTSISLTTNLWDYWLHPDKWVPLFKHHKVGVTTSFNYGETRRITRKENFTEEMFLKIWTKFKEDVGYGLDFISVITEENVDKAIDNVRLAKHLGVECKLNYAMASGEESVPYPVGKMYEIYAQIYKEGLGPWEFNTRQMSVRLKGHGTMCPQNRECDEGIRSLQPDKDGENYYSCGAFGDDGEYPISFEAEMKGEKFLPLQTQSENQFLKMECLTCKAYEICNGCYKTIRDLKKTDMVEESCRAMKRAIGTIEECDIVNPAPEVKERGFQNNCDDY